MTELILLGVGLRASVSAGAIVVLALYGRFPWLSLQSLVRGEGVDPPIINATAIWLAGLYSIAFVGKRVLTSVLLHETLNFDHNVWESAGTCFGLAVGTLMQLLFIYAWLKYRGLTRMAYGAAAFIALAGILFATFYAHAHRLI